MTDKKKASPMEEYLWIEQHEALQIEVPWEERPLSPMNLSTRMQAIVEEYLRLRAGEFGIWSRLDDEVNTDSHLLICQPEEGNWAMIQTYPSN